MYASPAGAMKRASPGGPSMLPCMPLPASTLTFSWSAAASASVSPAERAASVSVAWMMQNPAELEMYSSVNSSLATMSPMLIAVHCTRLSGWSQDSCFGLMSSSSSPTAPAARRLMEGSTTPWAASVAQTPLSAMSMAPTPPK